MSQPNPRTTGLFVLGAILLVVAGLVAFGSRSYFEHRPRAVTFFHGSVAGLVVGAPVTFRGVGVGSVLKILLQTNSTNGTAQIPVIMEFDPQRVTMIGGSDTAKFTERTKINGLGATLVMQSLITGQLAIELDYHDPTKVSSTGIDLGLPEIPEAEGGINAMKNTLSNLPELRRLGPAFGQRAGLGPGIPRDSGEPRKSQQGRGGNRGLGPGRCRPHRQRKPRHRRGRTPGHRACRRPDQRLATTTGRDPDRGRATAGRHRPANGPDRRRRSHHAACG